MSVLSLLTEQFPELYEASETRADQDNLGVPGVNDVATDNKTGSQSDVSHAAANDTPDAGQQDPYQQKIESITGRVGLVLFYVLCGQHHICMHFLLHSSTNMHGHAGKPCPRDG